MHLGVYSGIDRFHLEERAWNEATFRAADESGWMPAVSSSPLVLPVHVGSPPLLWSQSYCRHAAPFRALLTARLRWARWNHVSVVFCW